MAINTQSERTTSLSTNDFTPIVLTTTTIKPTIPQPIKYVVINNTIEQDSDDQGEEDSEDHGDFFAFLTLSTLIGLFILSLIWICCSRCIQKRREKQNVNCDDEYNQLNDEYKSLDNALAAQEEYQAKQTKLDNKKNKLFNLNNSNGTEIVVVPT